MGLPSPGALVRTASIRSPASSETGISSGDNFPSLARCSALAGASGSISIIYLNLTSFKGSDWAVHIRKKTDELSQRLQGLHFQLIERINRLQQEALKREGQTIAPSE